MSQKYIVAPVAFIMVLVLTGCNSESQQERSKLCTIGTLCDVPLPPPIELAIEREPSSRQEALRRRLNLEGNDVVFQVSPATEPSKSAELMFKLVFVSSQRRPNLGTVWILPKGRKEKEQAAQALIAGVDTLHTTFVTDGSRLAVLDSVTRVGPTFVFDYRSYTYVRQEYSSQDMRKDWERAVRSSCGGGPLAVIPTAWKEEYVRLCRS